MQIEKKKNGNFVGKLKEKINVDKIKVNQIKRYLYDKVITIIILMLFFLNLSPLQVHC